MGTEKQKFDGLSEGYDRYRPRYPAELLRRVAEQVVADPPTVIDAGAGTGIELEGLLPLLGPGTRCTAVDISGDMVSVGRTKFPSVDWVVEPVEPFLERATDVDLILAAQSFQWMDQPRFLRAAARCLNAGGMVAIIQNNRNFAASDFLDAYETLLEELSPGYSRHYRAFDFEGELREHLGPRGAEVDVTTADWVMTMPVEEFTGMAQSSTQAQRAIDAHGEVFLARLQALLADHADAGRVEVPYRSELFTARLPVGSGDG